MPPALALSLYFIVLFGLLLYDPAKETRTSWALWVPLIWMFIAGSRLPSQWLGGQVSSAAEAYQEGNPLDRTIFFVLIMMAIGILISRSFKWGDLLTRNLALVAFLSFALVSVLWSDFPFVAFKRWFRDLGNYLVVLVVLSDASPLQAVRVLLRRLSYLLIPLSIVLIKYYPQIGRGYSEWTGAVTYNGVTTGKDLLGTICLISGIFCFWDTMTRWEDRRQPRTRRIIMVNVAFIAMSLWLLYLADCATCRVCLVLGCLVIAAAHTRVVKRHPAPLKVFIPLIVCICLFLVFGVDMKATIASSVGRDATFTDRTLLWPYLLSLRINPLLGTGYESFWLGPRLTQIWNKWAFRPNQAHNGYLEVYLNLGLVGVCFIGGVLIASYRKISRTLSAELGVASLKLALWMILPIYNITTSDFGKGEVMWLSFLLVAIATPARTKGQLRSVAMFDNAIATKRLPSLPLRITGGGEW